ncbi:hypothetical protein NDU88_008599 [Pleurodeles waltl]|uniref:Uncharacterized protein n=1 Tax=Pleurodeles waltl TaxID=8319 RepID=A0AAV7RU93_PLEWA|nr:hypothetical protein NDU88_008599 [Pleurodeles waltl]
MEDGHGSAAEELSSGSDARKGDREDTKKTATGDDETGNRKLPRTWTAPEIPAGPQETSTFRHAPGGTWLNKVKERRFNNYLLKDQVFVDKFEVFLKEYFVLNLTPSL